MTPHGPFLFLLLLIYPIFILNILHWKSRSIFSLHLHSYLPTLMYMLFTAPSDPLHLLT